MFDKIVDGALTPSQRNFSATRNKMKSGIRLFCLIKNRRNIFKIPQNTATKPIGRLLFMLACFMLTCEVEVKKNKLRRKIMTKKFTLATILLLAVTIAIAPVANARIGKHALIGMAVCMGTTLTDEQCAAIQEKVAEMKEAGKSCTEIREAIVEMLKEYGIEIPDVWSHRLEKGYYLCADLTDEQRTAIQEKVTEMKEAGASRTEIREAVAEMLKGYGIEVPVWFIYLGKCYLCADLTDEQRTAIEEDNPPAPIPLNKGGQGGCIRGIKGD
jgi:hypothetical protein